MKCGWMWWAHLSCSLLRSKLLSLFSSFFLVLNVVMMMGRHTQRCWWGSHSKAGIGNVCLWINTGWPYVFVNKVWLGHSLHVFAYCLWLNSCYNNRDECLWLRFTCHSKPTVFTIWPFIESLLIPVLGKGRTTIWEEFAPHMASWSRNIYPLWQPKVDRCISKVIEERKMNFSLVLDTGFGFSLYGGSSADNLFNTKIN